MEQRGMLVVRLKRNTLTKIILIIMMLLLPILVLYAISNQVSMSVIKREVQAFKMKDLSFAAKELHSNMLNTEMLAFLLSDDIHIQNLRHTHLIHNAYERNEEILRVNERLKLLNVAGRWDTQYTIYVPEAGVVVSTNPNVSYNIDTLKDNFTETWEYKIMKVYNFGEERMVRHFVKPERIGNDLENAGLIVEVSFPKSFLVRHLDAFKSGGNGDPFLYHPRGDVILNNTADDDLIEILVEKFQSAGIDQFANEVIPLNGQQYLVTSLSIPALGWYLVDYVTLEEIVQPIVLSRNLFYGSVALLLLLSIIAGYLLYRNVQRPIAMLMRGVQHLRAGDYSVRVQDSPNNEFTFLFRRFNEMATEIEQLIQKVYVEQLRSREANLKQLQSQINPHFLYNCFALIRSLTRLGKHDSVMHLTLHLSKYYRHTTRVEKTMERLARELELIESYLEIQTLHIQHLSYRINVPDAMLELEIPRLLLQPLVENAVLHGIELSEGDGLIVITGKQQDGWVTLSVEDNGIGMTPEQLRNLEYKLLSPPDEETGCALWNVRQRLKLQFGERAHLSFQLREQGGLIVTMSWPEHPALMESEGQTDGQAGEQTEEQPA